MLLVTNNLKGWTESRNEKFSCPRVFPMFWVFPTFKVVFAEEVEKKKARRTEDEGGRMCDSSPPANDLRLLGACRSYMKEHVSPDSLSGTSKRSIHVDHYHLIVIFRRDFYKRIPVFYLTLILNDIWLCIEFRYI